MNGSPAEFVFPSRRRHRRWLGLGLGVVIAVGGGAISVRSMPAMSMPAASGHDDPIDFSRQIQPILARNCFACHGPDRGARKARLRLDTFEGATADRRGSSPIVPGNAQDSLLLELVTEPDPEFRMPPPEAKKTLTDEQIDLLTRWIEQGAQYEAHWAFSAPVRADVQPPTDASRGRHPIDAFIGARLEKEGLAPSPEADLATLIRRLSLDLTGLPASPGDVESFLADESPDAYENVVDRLLASPHYGERMAVDWLDAARYADTHGYHYDNERTMWQWRDWVVKSFNDNMPYDRFTIEQLAGDLLPGATMQQQIASGFNRNHGISWEGGIIPEEYRIEYVVDRVSTTATVWMGLTMGCARCHDHKFDPISQREFYSFSAFFNSIDENGLDGLQGNAQPLIPTPTPEGAEALQKLNAEIEQVVAEYEVPYEELDAAQREWESDVGTRWAGQWKVVDPIEFSTTGKATLVEQDDHSLLADGPHPVNDGYEIIAETDELNIGAVRFEALSDERLPGGGPGRASHSNLVLSEFELEIAPSDAPDEFVPVRFIAAQADFSQRKFFIEKAIDGDPKTGWAIQGRPYGEDRIAVFVPDTPFGFEGGTRMRFRIHHNSPYTQHSIGRVRLAISTDESMTADFAPTTFGPWRVSQPFAAESNRLAYETKFSPETEVDLDAVDDEGEPLWTDRPEFTDGTAHELEGEQTATYLHRTVEAPNARTVRLSLGSDDAFKLWLDGELFASSDAPRGVAPDQDFIDLNLTPGPHQLLLKVVNYGGEYAFYVEAREDNALDPPLGILTYARQAPDDRDDRQALMVRDHFRATNSQTMRDLIARRDELQKRRREMLASIPTAMIMGDLEEPRETFMLTRGRYDMQADPVEAGVPQVLSPMIPGAPNRLALARWLVDPAHPLTARVAVNRLWQQVFGRGIVESTDDFGTQGSPPTHPALLDWLATEFVRSGWDIKAMLKLMVMSATYRQTSACPPELLARDPDNLLLARGARFRLGAEFIRDQALASSGLLVPKLGGPPVKPYQPAGLWKEVGSDFDAFSANTYVQDRGEALYRRSLYTFWKRTLPPPSMTTFDAPSREFCIARRARTNTPQQALVLLNDPTYVEAARVLAERVMHEHSDEAHRLDAAVRLVLARGPTPKERALLLELLAGQRAIFSGEKDAALRLLNVGEAPRDESLDPAEHAAWTMVASTILNLDETVTRP